MNIGKKGILRGFHKSDHEQKRKGRNMKIILKINVIKLISVF